MLSAPSTPYQRWIIGLSSIFVLAAGAYGALQLTRYAPQPFPSHRSPMLVAPMVGVSDTCLQAPADATKPVASACTGEHGSAAALLESTLKSLDAPWLKNYSLGYTLPVPLMQLFRLEDSHWVVDKTRVQRVARTIRDSSRPLVLYLFSTHFSSGSLLEQELARDPANIAQTPSGSLPESSYYGAPIYNWSVATTENDLTRYRTRAIQAITEEICRLPASDLPKIRGITLLGELHHLFPSFETGMGFSSDYLITDYSQQSISDFQTFLTQRFGSVEKLNLVLGTSYTALENVLPPSRNIRTEPLNRYEEHIDSYAHGTFPVSGWLHAPQNTQPRIHVYRNGMHVGTTLANLTRRDVLEAKPAFGYANTGWRLDIDFKAMTPGLHRIDVYAELSSNQLTHLGSRRIAVMNRQQHTPAPQPLHPLPPSKANYPGVEATIDLPSEQLALFYNPLVPLWHEFRGLQIVRYLQHFERLMNSSCLAATPLYTHQLTPYGNPSWDANKFAVDASLGNLLPLRAGISLYGEAAYGSSFRQWLRLSPHPAYGITEFHPLKPMTSIELQDVFETHSRQGAAFLTFFLEPYWDGKAIERDVNLFSFDPSNLQFGSDALYRSLLRQAPATTSQ